MKTICGLIVILLVCSCQKDDSAQWDAYHSDEHNASYATFNIETNARTSIIIEKWGTGLDFYDGTYQVESHRKDNDAIFGRRFIASIFIDGKVEYLGWGTVCLDNLVTLTSLHPEKIDINNP